MLARGMLNENIGINFVQTPFGMCLVFVLNGNRIASWACEPNAHTSFQNEFGGQEEDITLQEAIDRVNKLL